jgi:hypothetical protein
MEVAVLSVTVGVLLQLEENVRATSNYIKGFSSESRTLFDQYPGFRLL